MSSKRLRSWGRGLFKRDTEGNIPSEDPASMPELPHATTNTPQGLEVVFPGDNPIVDIIAVHGLNGHREKTWTAANKINWLRHLLPDDLPSARIMCWGYDANTHDSSRVSCQYLYDHAQTLVSDLCRKRRLTDSVKRPIIFVAHSLGGIIVKSALIHSDLSRQGAQLEHRSIKLSTHGIVFMGTPHQGGNGVQLGQLLVNVASLFVAANDHILQHLKRDSEWLQQQLGQYGPISNEFITKYAYEEYETSTALGHKIMVVPRASAVVPGHADAESIVIHNDHINIVKFASKQDSGYEKISEYLQIMMMDADDRIQLRWKEEARIAEARIDPTFGQWFLPLSLPGVTRVVHFVAREDELARIHEILHRTDGRSTAIVQGLGGMGKTQLTLEYIKRHSEEYSAVIWLNAKDETSLKQTFAHAAERVLRQYPSIVYIQNAVRDKDLDQMTHAVKRWLEESRNSNWLVVYDNYDNPRFGNSTNEPDNRRENEDEATGLRSSASTDQGFDIRSFFPEGYQGAIIITTRSAAVKLGETISLGKFRNIHDSLQILAFTSHRQELDRDNAAQELARRLAGLPLALSTAGFYLSQVSTSWDQYLEMYNQSWLRLQKASPKLLTYDHAMYSTWDISYKYIERDDQNAAKLLQLWAYFDNEDIWFELLRAGASESEAWLQKATQDRISFDTTMRLLCSHGLVEANAPTKEWGKQSGGYSVHGCVHDWMMHALNKGAREDMSELTMRCVASHAPSENVAEYWLIQRRLLRHADRCQPMLRRKESSKNREWVTRELGRLFADQGRMKEAEDMYNCALQGYEKAWGPEHISTLTIVNNLGNLYFNQGRLKEAEEMYNRALQVKEKAWGPEHISTLDTVNNLGNLYSNQGRWKEAEDIYNRSLQGKEKAWGPGHKSTLDTVNNLGILYKDQGRWKEAEDMYNRALQGYKKAWGPEHISTLDTVNNLGILYFDQGRWKEAEDMYNCALQGYEKAWGPEHMSTLTTVNNLGNLYFDQGRLKEAEDMYNCALQGYKKAWGPEHISTLDTVNNLGNLYSNQRRWKEAEDMYNCTLQGYEKAWGPGHKSTLDTVNNLGILYFNQGRWKEAEEMYNCALQGKETAWGPEHISTLDTVNNLGNLYSNQRRWKEAEDMYNRALQGYKKAWGPEHISTLDTVNNLGTLYFRQGRLKEAEDIYNRALQGYEKAIGNIRVKTYPPALSTLENLGDLLQDIGKNCEARKLWTQAVEGVRLVYGSMSEEWQRISIKLTRED